IIGGLIPRPLPKPEGDNDNAIVHRNITLFGAPGTGKTSLGYSIGEAIGRLNGDAYGLRTTRNLPALFQALPRRLLQVNNFILFADDLTKALAKLRKIEREEVMDKWFDVRGELFKRGVNQGMVWMVGAAHSFYGLPLDFRRDADLVLARSTGTNPFDRRSVGNMFGSSTVNLLRGYEAKAQSNRDELGWTAWATKGASGIVFVARPTSI